MGMWELGRRIRNQNWKYLGLLTIDGLVLRTKKVLREIILL